MKKLLLSCCILVGLQTTNAQTVLLNENFDSYTDFVITGFGSWLTLDLDGLNTYTGGTAASATWANAGAPQAFQIFNPTTAGVSNNATANGITGDYNNEVRNFDPHSGTKFAAAWNAVPTGATGNNDWLISPPVQLGSAGNNLSLWVKSLSNTYGLEKYKVGVYVGSGNPTSSADFTIISGASSLSAPYGTWEEKTYALNTYSGQTVRIGIQCVSNDNYMFMVDDVKVTTTSPLSTSEVNKKSTASIVYPNPTKDVLNIKSDSKINSVEIFDISGKRMNAQLDNNQVDVRHLTPGTYMISIETKDGKTSEKFIKK